VDGAAGAISGGAAGADIAADPVEGTTTLELVSGCAGGNGRSVMAGASIASRSP
jgi:hypothetical protein